MTHPAHSLKGICRQKRWANHILLREHLDDNRGNVVVWLSVFAKIEGGSTEFFDDSLGIFLAMGADGLQDPGDAKMNAGRRHRIRDTVGREKDQVASKQRKQRRLLKGAFFRNAQEGCGTFQTLPDMARGIENIAGRVEMSWATIEKYSTSPVGDLCATSVAEQVGGPFPPSGCPRSREVCCIGPSSWLYSLVEA